MSKKIVFVTGTRADFGKLKPLIAPLDKDTNFECHIFITGMHMLAKYGYTCEEVLNAKFRRPYQFINQNPGDLMDHVLAKTVMGLSDFVREQRPDLIVIHGDRVEALAGAIVGSLNHILTAHIEGGEVSGTIDELIRHSVTKLAHLHFVANEQSAQRLQQLGETDQSIYVIGSPDIDVMNSSLLPPLSEVRRHYAIDFDEYAIAMFHPVTSEAAQLPKQATIFVDQLLKSDKNYIVIYPNNDPGTDIIFQEYERFAASKRFRMFPSMRFEYFLTLLKFADFVIGNSSAGVREAPHYGVPSINVGTRQHSRVSCRSVVNVAFCPKEISSAIARVASMPREQSSLFGDGCSARRFQAAIQSEKLWATPIQKYFVDREIL